MADASRPPPHLPSDWGTLFAALPQEAPPTSRWPRIEAALAARARARRRRLVLGMAAGLCALAALPLTRHLRETPPAQVPAVSTASPVSPVAPSFAPSTAAQTSTPIARAQPAPVATPTAVETTMPTTRATVAHAPRHATVARPDAAKQPWPDAAIPDGALEVLYAESAQLESLLAVARDTRVESGPAAAMASAYEADLAEIDARLALDDLAEAEEVSLWRARVDTLRRSAGFESQQRLLAADGVRFDGALVGID